MKKRKAFFGAALIMFAAAGCTAAQDSTSAPEWKATVTVIDEEGHPVPDADITIGYYAPPPEGQTIASSSVKGRTDINGVFSASGHTRSTDLFFGAAKAGYYRTHADHAFHTFKDSDRAKWNPSVTLVLKKIEKPIPVYAKWLNLGMPAFDKPIGFDLEAGDWVAPYGHGTTTDIIFAGHLDRRTEFDSDYKLAVSFPKQGDGIQEFSLPEAEKGSALRSPHTAPQDGYAAEWTQTDSRRPGQPVETNRDENRNYFFRVRTVLDERGNVKSALYGKIYGDFMKFRYYLNPTPNDRNIEFEPKSNLFKGLASSEKVEAP